MPDAKLALFVEGQTEQIFLERFLREILATDDLRIISDRVSGGRKYDRMLIEITSENERGQRYFVLIRDCSADERVASEIREAYADLVAQDYSKIIAVRDLRPHSRQDKHRVVSGFQSVVPISPVPVILVLAIMEIEAWFIGECSHFPRIDGNLSIDKVERYVGYDPCECDVERVDWPASDLHKAYGSVGLYYDKSRYSVERTVNALDINYVRGELRERVPSVRQLIDEIERCFGY